MNYYIIIPIYNDWKSFLKLVSEIELEYKKFENNNISISIIAVDDGSIEDIPNQISYDYLKEIKIVRLGINLGHQRSIAIGISYALQELDLYALIIMDGDGEDRPVDLFNLIRVNKKDPESVLVAKRSKRTESLFFRLGYFFNRFIFRILTGISLPYGNFSLIPLKAGDVILYSSDFWNHYAAALSRTRLNIKMIPTVRGYRYHGKSKMNFFNLVLHSLNALAVYTDRVAVRMIITSIIILLFSIFMISYLILLKVLTEKAIPGWTSQLVAIFGVASMLSFGFATLLAFINSQFRHSKNFIPKFDCLKYVKEIKNVK
jgi:hypothetical protein